MNHSDTLSDKHQDGLPSPDPTPSYWLRHLSKSLAGHRTTDDLPSIVDVVVVGSGITGAFAARELVKDGNKSILMLEAREACSGATGRVSLRQIRCPIQDETTHTLLRRMAATANRPFGMLQLMLPVSSCLRST